MRFQFCLAELHVATDDNKDKFAVSDTYVHQCFSSFFFRHTQKGSQRFDGMTIRGQYFFQRKFAFLRKRYLDKACLFKPLAIAAGWTMCEIDRPRGDEEEDFVLAVEGCQ